eukprot:GHUV01043204.1.p1 GENE.GHUV01043204.1~~GHUV01043204.1.p1  ORF type:complete len:233 (+),score=48.11 GHUV01043204.1:180-878(+)
MQTFVHHTASAIFLTSVYKHYCLSTQTPASGTCFTCMLLQVRRQVTTEVKALDGSRHPHIVQYHQSYFANGALTILMEFMDGGSLWDVLQKIRIVPQQYLPELARQVLSGLSYLHDTARICHRDIKPGNLLLSSSGQLKISDFGVSSQLSNSMSRCLSWVGTVTYMSPERIRGDSYSFNTDVWSVGLLLLECATGRYPYPPESGATAAGPPRLGFWELLEYIGELCITLACY